MTICAVASIHCESFHPQGAGAVVDKEAMLLALCSKAYAGGRTIVFFRTKARAHRAKLMFGLASLGAAAELHGDMTQATRLASLEAFRKVSLYNEWLSQTSVCTWDITDLYSILMNSQLTGRSVLPPCNGCGSPWFGYLGCGCCHQLRHAFCAFWLPAPNRAHCTGRQRGPLPHIHRGWRPCPSQRGALSFIIDKYIQYVMLSSLTIKFIYFLCRLLRRRGQP